MKLLRAILAEDPFISVVFLPLRLFAIVLNICFILEGIPYAHDDEAADIISKSIFPKKWIESGDRRLKARRHETEVRLSILRAQLQNKK